MLSVSATFAADDNTDAVAIDEMSDDEPLAIDEDSQTLSEGDVVTNDTFYNYFDSTGSLLPNVTSSELTFKGDISGIGLDTIVLERPIKITGDNAIITNISIMVESSDVVISGLTINQNDDIASIFIYNATNVQIEKTTIYFIARDGADGYAIYASLADNLKLIDNTINYAGTSAGYGKNNGLYVSESNGANIKGNKFNLYLNSLPVGWEEVPAGSGNWVSSPVSEGIVIDSSNGVTFQKNDVVLNYVNASGKYDTIYTVDFKNSNGSTIDENNIVANGHSYIYGILISGNDFMIIDNVIKTESDNLYANGIDIEGPATGIVHSNEITAKGVTSAYPIYSGMNGYAVNATYYNNTINGEAYFVIGMSLGDVESSIILNEITLEGNYTTGIAYRGDKIGIASNRIVLTSSEEGNVSISESFGVDASGIKIFKGEAYIADNVIATPGKGVYLKGNVTSAELGENFINVVGNDDKDAYAIYVDSIEDLKVIENTIDYQGLTKGTGINNAVYIYNVTGATFSKNNFTLDLVSCYVPWIEIPSGSGNWVSFPISEGIVFVSVDNATFEENNVELTYGDIVGMYDTIYAVDFKNSDNALIKGNTIDANGHSYIYGIIISGENFTIYDNDIETESDNCYANGIDVEGPATGVIYANEIHATGVQSAYPIYSGMNGQDVSVNYTNNDLYGNAYYVVGMSLGDVESNIVNNCIYVDGNYTKGIASKVDKLSVTENLIVSSGSNVGNKSAGDSFGLDTYGIKVVSGDAYIANNTIKSTSDYAIYMAVGTSGSIANNTLVANNVGVNAIYLDSAIAVSGTGPQYKTIIISSDLTKAYDAATQFVVTLIDENGNPVAGKTVVLTTGVELIDVATTNARGVARFNAYLPVGTYKVVASFDGDNVYGPKEVTNKIVVNKAATKISASKKTFKVKTKTKKYTVTVKANNKALAKVKVTLKVNGKTFKATTNAKGKATFKITNLKKTGKFTATVKFAGNKSYKASSAKAVITVK